ncbi:MAG: spore germination protein [Clostridiales bacterium]|nr:spore germination protein [Clostridiales bacterium]
MKKNGFLQSLLTFDEPYRAFELLETEHTPVGANCVRPPDQTSAFLQENIIRIKTQFHADINGDLILREFLIGGSLPACAVLLSGMADQGQVGELVLKPAQRETAPIKSGVAPSDHVVANVFALNEVELTSEWTAITKAIAEGRTAVFLEGDLMAVLLDTRGFVSRGVGETGSEVSVLGPKEAFTENARTNITLLRRIIKTDDFICEFREAGGQNKTSMIVCYRQGITNPALLREVRDRLNKIDTLEVLAAGVIDQLIEDHPLFPLPQILETERPDRAANAIMKGKVVLICEGCPQVSILPVTLQALFASAEDTYMRRPLGALVRFVRLFGALLTVFAPGYFLAIAMFHPYILSNEVLTSLIASRAMLFMPLWAEMLFVLLIFQLVREAGVRVPGSIGHSISIIGGLVLGQAAVAANLISAVVLVIVALTGLGNMAIPEFQTMAAASWFRLAFCIVGAMGGLFALSCALVALTAWLCSVKSFGVPFLAPFAPHTSRRTRRDKRAPDYLNTGRAAI